MCDGYHNSVLGSIIFDMLKTDKFIVPFSMNDFENRLYFFI